MKPRTQFTRLVAGHSRTIIGCTVRQIRGVSSCNNTKYDAAHRAPDGKMADRQSCAPEGVWTGRKEDLWAQHIRSIGIIDTSIGVFNDVRLGVVRWRWRGRVLDEL